MKEKSNLIDLLLVIFLGIFGYIPFKNKKYGLGTIYILTAGLFTVGWIIDVVKQVEIFINSRNMANSDFKISNNANKHDQSFNLRGIHYENRQDNMYLVDVGIELTPKFYLFENEPAIEFFVGGKSVGHAPHELAPLYHDSNLRFVINRTYTMDGGIKGAEVLVQHK